MKGTGGGGKASVGVFLKKHVVTLVLI